MRHVSDKFVEKIKTMALCSINVFQILCHLWDNVKTYGGARHATDDTVIQRRKMW